MQLVARDTLDVECRLAPDDAGTFTGYAARFGEVNAHGEIVMPGAFARTIRDHQTRGANPPMLWSHDQSQPIGVWDDLREDATGLAVRGRIVMETAKGREAHALMKAGAITGLSIGFRNAKATRNAQGVRTISDLDLGEISLVTLPSASNARVTSVRNRSGLAGFTEAVKAATQTLKGGK
jgi:HK97 family phage prohead protease